MTGQKQNMLLTLLLLVQAIPVVTVWIGVFPLAITRELTLAATLYITSIFALLFRVRTTKHFKCLYYAGNLPKHEDSHTSHFGRRCL
jgi:hypothetical protein